MEIHTCEMHTGGEPVRIITSGYPEVKGDTILEKWRYVKENLDHLRKRLMFEPRGHKDMYGALVIPADHPDADIAVLFMDNGCYSTMCGHASIACVRYAVDKGFVKLPAAKESDDAVSHVPVNIQCPCGLVQASVEMKGKVTGAVSFVSVPAFAVALDIFLETKSFGRIQLDLGFGGAFYAIVDIHQLKLDLDSATTQELTAAATEISQVVKRTDWIVHPLEKDLSYLYGTILTDGKDQWSTEPTRNLCVFANEQVDRSPCGSGVTARVAVMKAKGCMDIGQARQFKNAKTGSVFTGQVDSECECGDKQAVRVKVSGRPYYTGRAVFTVEEDDPLKDGFLINQATVFS